MTIEGESLGASWETLSGATAKISGMGAGVQAVKQKLNSGFEPIEFREMYDMNADSTSIVFESHGQSYSVRVSREFDDDFLSGTTASLWNLVTVLKASLDKKVVVKTTGVSEA
jgi:hypothetical protein